MGSANSFSGNDFDSPSPYPPSSPSLGDSDDDLLLAQSSRATFRSSLASVPESTLRSIVVKLADSNPRFQRAIIKELAYINPDSPPTTPTIARTAHRGKNRRNCKNLSVAMASPLTYRSRSISMSSESPRSPDDSMYHPVGHLEDEVYEFLSRTPDDVAFNVVRTISMWSCCDEDEWSPGCVAAPSYPLPEGHQPGIVSFSDDVFPDSDLEQRFEVDPTFCQPANRGA
ncbi:hypothetical protein CVT25_011920 [Psilocybe cyanescens]|uniref:Uncharacterized protein n=1 Tax=Psilocybe cyanescens TaxID=93625 RepID=A0A409XCN8_PSICY|nr:hypothetical protein CVT25_011920 [Psilocybe cyanescens]